MKFIVVVNLFILFVSIKCERMQRLVLPTTASMMKIIPKVEMPMVSSNTIQSGFGFELPISIRFPSAMDVVEAVRQTMFSGNNDITTKQPSASNRTRTNSRAQLYRHIEKSHKNFGKVCLLRAICEASEVPFMSASTGLVGEIVDMLLTSSILSDTTGLLSVYKEAEKIGKKGMKSGDKCKIHYKGCPLSLFNIINIPFN